MMVRYSELVFLCTLACIYQASFGLIPGRTLLTIHDSKTITMQPRQSITYKLNRNDNFLAIRVEEIEYGAKVSILDRYWNRITFERTWRGVEMIETSADQSERNSIVFLPHSIKLPGRKAMLYCNSGHVVISYKAYSETDLLCDSSNIISHDSNHEVSSTQCSHGGIPPEGDADCTVNLVCPSNYFQRKGEFRCIPSSDGNVERQWNGNAFCEPQPDIMEQCTNENFDIGDEDNCPFSSVEVINYMYKNDQLDVSEGLGRSGTCVGRSTRWFNSRCGNFCTRNGKIKVRTCRKRGWNCVACVRRLRCALNIGACYLP